jgi:prespore-specific regulator
MKVRQDAWSHEDDLLLAETVLRHIREGSTQLQAFEEVGDHLNRTSAACGFRWNAVVRRKYDQAIAIAKKQRKERKRALAKQQVSTNQGNQSDTNRLSPSFETVEFSEEYVPYSERKMHFKQQNDVPSTEVNVQQVQQVEKREDNISSISDVIAFLQNMNRSNQSNQKLLLENERLKNEMQMLLEENNKLKRRVEHLENEHDTIQEDYQSFLKIMDRARKMVVFSEEEEMPATAFKMDKNGNLEKIAK